MVAERRALVASEGVGHDNRLRLLEEHRAKKAEKVEDDTLQQAGAYMEQTREGVGTYVAPLRRVPCTVPGYTHLTPVYNIGLPYRRMREIPKIEAQHEGESDELYVVRYYQWTAQLPRWMTLFIVRIDGWDLTDLDGNPLPMPVSEDVRGYDLIAQCNEVLLTFLAFDGYERALADSVGEAGARSSRASKRGSGRVSAPDAQAGRA